MFREAVSRNVVYDERTGQCCHPVPLKNAMMRPNNESGTSTRLIIS
jgi:hypothetical protein